MKYNIIILIILYTNIGLYAQKTIKLSTPSLGEQKLSALLEMRLQVPMATNIRICSPSRHSMANPPLFILDGIEAVNGDSLKIEPNNIESMEVLNNKKALEPYGDKGKNGVIIITSKKK